MARANNFIKKGAETLEEEKKRRDFIHTIEKREVEELKRVRFGSLCAKNVYEVFSKSCFISRETREDRDLVGHLYLRTPCRVFGFEFARQNAVPTLRSFVSGRSEALFLISLFSPSLRELLLARQEDSTCPYSSYRHRCLALHPVVALLQLQTRLFNQLHQQHPMALLKLLANRVQSYNV